MKGKRHGTGPISEGRERARILSSEVLVRGRRIVQASDAFRSFHGESASTSEGIALATVVRPQYAGGAPAGTSVAPDRVRAPRDTEKAIGEKMTEQGQAIADHWDKNFNNGNTDALGKLYSEEGKVVPAGGSPVQGSQSIAAFFTDLQAKGFRDHKITVQDATQKGETLILTGRWQLNGPGEGGETQSYGGNWVNVLERQGEGWRTLLHTWN